MIDMFPPGLVMRFSRPVLTRRGNARRIIHTDRHSKPHCTQLVPYLLCGRYGLRGASPRRKLKYPHRETRIKLVTGQQGQPGI